MIRTLDEGLSLLFRYFLEIRLGKQWAATLLNIQRWLKVAV